MVFIISKQIFLFVVKNSGYNYDNAGRLWHIEKENGVHLEFIYDVFGRIIVIHEIKGLLAIERIRKFYDDTTGIVSFLSSIDNVDTILSELTNIKGKTVADVSIYYDSTAVEDRYVVDMYSYNNKGNISAKYKYIPGLHWQKVEIQYNFTGNIKSKTVHPEYLSGRGITPITTDFNYDNLNRLQAIKDNATGKNILDYEYTETGLLKKKRFKNSITSQSITSVDYDYNIRDWIKNISENNFFEELHYTDQYNGNISKANYEYKGSDPLSVNLDYGYDGVNRLTNVTANCNDISRNFNEAFKYDNIGRILQTRRDSNSLDNYYENIYHYIDSTNRLQYVSTKHGATDNYSYDSSGNMIEDKSKLMQVTYDWRDMPIQFKLRKDTATWATVDMVYDASGNRVLKTEKTTTDVNAVAYVDDELVYEKNYPDSNFMLANAYIPNGEGRVDFDGNEVSTKYLFIKDHLGTTRSVVADDGDLVSKDMYFAYGAKDPLHVGTKTFRKEFTGKEFDKDGANPDAHPDSIASKGMGLYYFGKRYYDPEIIRWISTDPGEQFWDLYAYAGNGFNPILGTDPDGSIFGQVLSPGETRGDVVFAGMTPAQSAKAFVTGMKIGGIYAYATWGGYALRWVAVKLVIAGTLGKLLGEYDPETKPDEPATFGKDPEIPVENLEETTEETTEPITPPPLPLPPPPPGGGGDDGDDTPSGTITIDTSEMSEEAQEEYEE